MGLSGPVAIPAIPVRLSRVSNAPADKESALSWVALDCVSAFNAAAQKQKPRAEHWRGVMQPQAETGGVSELGSANVEVRSCHHVGKKTWVDSVVNFFLWYRTAGIVTPSSVAICRLVLLQSICSQAFLRLMLENVTACPDGACCNIPIQINRVWSNLGTDLLPDVLSATLVAD